MAKLMGPRLLRASDATDTSGTEAADRRHRPGAVEDPSALYVCAMEFAFTDRCNEYRAKLLDFMDEHVYPDRAGLPRADPGESATRTTIRR